VCRQSAAFPTYCPTCRSSFPRACWQTRSRNRSPKEKCYSRLATYRLEQGLLKVSIASPQGDERILTILGPGSIVGELAIIDGLPRSATVVAIRDCKLSFISREAFVSCLREYPEIYSDLVAILVSRLREADRAMAAASFLTVKARVARALLELAEHLGRETESGRIVILHKIRQSDIAAMAGVARENVSRTLTELKRRGLISQSSSYYFINDKRKLLRETEDEDIV